MEVDQDQAGTNALDSELKQAKQDLKTSKTEGYHLL